jgi:hypothetical protein
MKYHPNYIIFRQVLRYLNPKEQMDLKNKLGALHNTKRPFLNCIKRNFNIERFRDDPLIPEDKLLYEYLVYEADLKTRRDGSIAMYERSAFVVSDTKFFAALGVPQS